MSSTRKPSSHPDTLLAGTGTISLYRERETIYSQGEAAREIYYICRGIVVLTVQSKSCRPAVVAVLGAGDFFNELCLLGQPRCLSTAVTITSTSIRAIEKEEMIRMLRHNNGLTAFFQNRLLTSTMRFREDVVDLHVNSTERRLARLLLRLARAGSNSRRMARLPAISQQALAEMVGTTRSRINLFMNRFRKGGFIHYDGGELEVRGALRHVLLDGRGHQASPERLAEI
ncbi:MAG TPA: Crp/Fnr family transcriptional regulator [Patescibacteria group bacterium]|nr:Crp/Fnr family transcriptional regulator [Patescibacteria group bacterium]